MLIVHTFQLIPDEDFLIFFQKNQNKLPSYLLNKIESLNFPADQQRSLIADLLVRAFYAKLMNVEWDSIEFKYNNHDKPCLKDFDGQYFNISHSDTQVVVAFSDEHIGVDVEKIKGDRRKVAQRFFTKGEISDMRKAGTKAEQILYFYQLWTLKESYMKAIGRGISMSLRSFGFRNIFDNYSLAFSSEDPDWFFNSMLWEDDYYLSICSKYDKEPEIVQANMEDLLVIN